VSKGEISQLEIPNRVRQLVSVDFYGLVPQGRGGVRYLFVCLDVFSEYIKLYPLKLATARASLKRLIEDISNIVKPDTILSDNEKMQPTFAATARKRKEIEK
jgi:hypothetical protein